MPILPSNRSYILSEETDTESPISEQTLQKIGQSINFLNDRFQLSQTVFNSNGTFTPPEGVDTVLVLGCGGGGGGGSKQNNTLFGSIGGFGAQFHAQIVSVVPLAVVNIVIGGGGGGSPTLGGNGVSSSFGSVVFEGASGGGQIPNSPIGTSTGLVSIGGWHRLVFNSSAQTTSGNPGGFIDKDSTGIGAAPSKYRGFIPPSVNLQSINYGNLLRGGTGAFGIGGPGGNSALGGAAIANTGGGGGSTQGVGAITGGNGGSGKIIVVF